MIGLYVCLGTPAAWGQMSVFERPTSPVEGQVSFVALHDGLRLHARPDLRSPERLIPYQRDWLIPFDGMPLRTLRPAEKTIHQAGTISVYCEGDRRMQEMTVEAGESWTYLQRNAEGYGTARIQDGICEVPIFLEQDVFGPSAGTGHRLPFGRRRGVGASDGEPPAADAARPGRGSRRHREPRRSAAAGVVKLRRTMHSSPRPAPASLGSARTRHRVPLRKCSRAEHPVVRGAKQVASNPDEILHDAMDGREALQVAGRFEAPHLMFALAGRLMRDLGPVVRIPVGHMADGGHDPSAAGGVARQLVRHEPGRGTDPWCFNNLRKNRIAACRLRRDCGLTQNCPEMGQVGPSWISETGCR